MRTVPASGTATWNNKLLEQIKRNQAHLGQAEGCLQLVLLPSEGGGGTTDLDELRGGREQLLRKDRDL